MRILFLNQTFHPDVVATAQYLAQVTTALTERGHEVTVVASRRAYDDPARTFAPRETWEGVKVFRVWSTRFGKGAKWRRAVDFASYLLCCCGRLVCLPRSDVVVALTSPPLISFIGAWLARVRGSRLVYWVMDFNPDEALAAGWLRRDSFAARGLESCSRFSLRHASRILVLDRFMRELVLTKNIPAERVTIIPPWSHGDAVQFDEPGRERFREQHGLAGKFVVMYSGNHSPCHPLDTVLAAAERLQADPRFKFVFVGGGSEFRRIQQRIAEQGNGGNLLCLPYQPLNELSASLSAADLHVVVMGNPFVGTIHPCKIYNVLSVGAPVLYVGPQPSHVSEVLDSLEATLCARVDHGDIDDCVGQIRRLAGQLPSRNSKNQRKTAAAFSQQNWLPRFVEEIENCR
ncbi:MAG: glycosyltransferase family 4 protein [Verrucomicrobia bacterium]|nr:glycosyltransferase family 4 protein [Verrucomicrobiota bacterium]